MKHITGLKKYLLVLATTTTNMGLLKIPIRSLYEMLMAFRYEKMTKVDGKYFINSFMPPMSGPAFKQCIKANIAACNSKVIQYSTNIAITARCTSSCWHCSNAYRSGDELSKDKWIRTLRMIQDIGVSYIGFTGGEPLLRDDLEDILESIDERSAVVLYTSGAGLTRERAEKLKSLGLGCIVVSLDHYKKEENDKLRGLKGAFEAAVKAIECSLKNDIYVAVQLTARNDFINERDMDAYIKFCDKLGVYEIRITEPKPTGRLIKHREIVGAFVEDKKSEFLKHCHEKYSNEKTLPKVIWTNYLEDKEFYGCGAGVRHMYIDAFGNLCPCDFLPISYGNIVSDGFDVVYNKMRMYFRHPRKICFVMENKDLFSANSRVSLPLEYEANAEILEKIPDYDLPGFYKKLGWVSKKS